MITHKINEYWTIQAADGFQKVPLPGLDAWLEALRSGTFKKGRHTLCDDDGYCCLGVLSKVQGRLRQDDPGGNWVDGDRTDGDGGGLYRTNPLHPILDSLGLLPPSVYVFHQERPQANNIIPTNTLSGVNDATCRLDPNDNFDTVIAVLEFCYENAP